MPRQFNKEEQLIVATHNVKKFEEIKDLLGAYVSDFKSAAELDLPEPEETEDTFVGNAVLKAQAAAKETGQVALADDSGFAVSALDGAPGIYSARWAVTDAGRDFNMAMEKVNDKMGDNPDRSTAFICVMALAWPDGHVETFEGRIEGVAVWPPRGPRDFGYDPMFLPDGHDQTFAEMDKSEKQKISHRALAFKKLVAGSFAP